MGAFDLGFASGRLRAFGAEYGEGGRPARYVLGGDALLNERSVLPNASLLMRLINRYGRLITVELPFSASIVLAKSNLRVMGLGPRADLTARVQVRNCYGSLRREIMARRTIEALHARRPVDPAGPRIPKLLKRGPTWFVEQQVAGHHASAAEVHRFVRLHLPALYERTVRARPYRGPTPLPALLAEARVHLPTLPAHLPAGLWPVALCSADLSSSNLLCAPDGAFWMIDWESSRVMAIALDLAPACVDRPALTDAALEIIGRFTPPGGVAPELQLLLGLARESLRHTSELKRRIADEVRIRRTSEASARQAQARHAARIHDLMRTIVLDWPARASA